MNNLIAKTAVFVCAVCLFFSGTIMAVTAQPDVVADVWADVYWDTLNITCDGGLTLLGLDNDTGLFYESYSEAITENSLGESEYATDGQPSWSGTYADVNISTSKADAWTNDTIVTGSAYSSAYNDGVTEIESYSESTSVRVGAFIASGSGTVTVTIDYAFEIGLYNAKEEQSVLGGAQAWLYVHNDGTGDEDFMDDWLDIGLDWVGDSLENCSGQLEVVLEIEDGEVLSFDTGVSMGSAVYIVPEPCTLALMVLGGLVLRRGAKSY